MNTRERGRLRALAHGQVQKAAWAGVGARLAVGGVARAKGRGEGGLGATQQPEGVAGSGAQLRWGRSSSKLLKQARPCPRGSTESPCTVLKLRSPSQAGTPRFSGLRTRASSDPEQTSRVRARLRLEAASCRGVRSAAGFAGVSPAPAAGPPVHGHARRVCQRRPLRLGWARGCAGFAHPEGFECQCARTRARGKGRPRTPWASCRCSVFAVLTHPQQLKERCNVTGGGEGRELESRQGGASVSSAPDCVPPPRVMIHQSRCIWPLTCTWVWSVPLRYRRDCLQILPIYSLSVSASVNYILFSYRPLRPCVLLCTNIPDRTSNLCVYPLYPFFLGQWLLLSSIPGHGETLG